jgi:mannosyl-oligosaccharide alpha-1,2-mannosidase
VCFVTLENIHTNVFNAISYHTMQAFMHTYNGYTKHAFGYDELRPLSKEGINQWGSMAVTLVDALDTYALPATMTATR